MNLLTTIKVLLTLLGAPENLEVKEITREPAALVVWSSQMIRVRAPGYTVYIMKDEPSVNNTVPVNILTPATNYPGIWPVSRGINN
jgi:hypothetical protein